MTSQKILSICKISESIFVIFTKKLLKILLLFKKTLTNRDLYINMITVVIKE